MSFKFWQSRLRSRTVGKLPGVINVPAFSVQSGKLSCMIMNGNAPINSINTDDDHFVTDGFTISFWIKWNGEAGFATPGNYICTSYSDALALGIIRVFMLDGYIVMDVLTSDTDEITSTNKLQPGQWTHVAIRYFDNSAEIYLNGLLDAVSDPDTFDGVGDINNQQDGAFYIGFPTNDYTTNDSEIRLSQFQFWDHALDVKTIESYMDFPGLNIEQDGLLIWAPFNELDLAQPYDPDGLYLGYPYNLKTGLVFPNPDGVATYVQDYHSCRVYGMSFIVGEYTINTVDEQRFSLNAPVTKPDCVNFVLAVSYVVEDCGCPYPATKRYRFWDYSPLACVGDSCKDDVLNSELYCGQVLPSGSKLEVWSIDGQVIASLDEVLELITSIMTPVTTILETEKTESADLGDINTNLGTAFPLEFPLVFDQPLTF